MKALSDTAGPEGLTPTALALGMIPKIPLGHAESMPLSQRGRFAAMEKARKEMEAIAAELRLKIARCKRAPELHPLKQSISDPALAFREGSKRWEGPCRFASQHNKTAAALDSTNNAHDFSISVVKLLNSALRADIANSLALPSPSDRSVNELEALVSVIVSNPSDCRFGDAKKEEIEGLIKRGDFEVVDRNYIPKD